ncbi:MAG: hypothetical protein HKN81_10810 [Gammaproteobacteria bacterium]|nr:hypothetical protein [Gammaproteobacteria bacterium]
MDRAKKILVNILTGLMIAVVAGIASNGAKGEGREIPSSEISGESSSVSTERPGH